MMHDNEWDYINEEKVGLEVYLITNCYLFPLSTPNMWDWIDKKSSRIMSNYG